MKEYDLAVIGGGPAGYTAALRAAKCGMKVAVAEREFLGGTCLNRGCIPAKCLLRSSELYASRTEWAELGIVAEGVDFDENAVYARKDAVVGKLRGGVESLIKSGGIDMYRGEARLTDAHCAEVCGERLSARFILIATGSRPVLPDVKGAGLALTSDDVFARPADRGAVAVIGGGVIGAELSQYFADTGRKVFVIEYADRILPMFGKDVSAQLAAALKRRGAEIFTSARVTEICADGVNFTHNGERRFVSCGTTVAAVGRRANVENLGLDEVGVNYGRYINTDGDMRTSVANVFAAGDVTGGIQLAHYAAACASRAVDVMCGVPSHGKPEAVPSIVYTDPEIVSVGSAEGAVKCGRFMLGANGKNLINGSDRGFVKIYCDGKDRVIAAEMLGRGVSETAGELTLAVSAGLTAAEVARCVHAHPTVYESIAEACEDVYGKAVHKR